MIPADNAPDDAHLVRRCREGDHDAFAGLVRRHQAVAMRVAALLGPPEEAEDACQDAFVKAFRSLHRFDAARPFRPWFLAVVANEARTRRRSAGRAARLLERAAALPPPPGAEDGAGERALTMAGLRVLRDAFARLRPAEQRTLALRFMLDLSEEEAAAVLGCAPGTVKSRTSRALARMRAGMEEPT